ncbi:MAG: methyltransferase domain-containing protein [Candidatus Aenigmarchaeota archaeon]|nr:methyltransferase domain-containing protein [Candidatus Aenigmarchaeota archaeon]
MEYFRYSTHNLGILDAIRRHVPLSRGDLVLDVGCGTGALVTLLALRTPAQVVGINKQARILFDRELGYFTSPFPEARQRSSIVLGNGFTLPIRPGSAKLITLIEVLDHVQDNPAFLRSVAAALAPGGYLCIVVPSRRQLLDHHFGEVSQLPLFGFLPARIQDRLLARGAAKGSWLYHLFSKRDLIRLLAGFDILLLEHRPYVFDHVRKRFPLAGLALRACYGLVFSLFPGFGSTLICIARKR